MKNDYEITAVEGDGCGVCANSEANNAVASAMMETNRRRENIECLLQLERNGMCTELLPEAHSGHLPIECLGP
jgi:hypothetical protein